MSKDTNKPSLLSAAAIAAACGASIYAVGKLLDYLFKDVREEEENETPVEDPAEEPVEDLSEEPLEDPFEEPAEDPAGEPVEDPSN